MSDFLRMLAEQCGIDPDAPISEFRPILSYWPGIKFLICLTEDCRYVSKRVADFTELLFHPEDDRLVGFKLVFSGHNSFPLEIFQKLLLRKDVQELLGLFKP